MATLSLFSLNFSNFLVSETAGEWKSRSQTYLMVVQLGLASKKMALTRARAIISTVRLKQELQIRLGSVMWLDQKIKGSLQIAIILSLL